MNIYEAASILSNQEFNFSSKEKADEFCKAYNMAINSLDVLVIMRGEFEHYEYMSGETAADIVNSYIEMVEDR